MHCVKVYINFLLSFSLFIKVYRASQTNIRFNRDYLYAAVCIINSEDVNINIKNI